MIADVYLFLDNVLLFFLNGHKFLKLDVSLRILMDQADLNELIFWLSKSNKTYIQSSCKIVQLYVKLALSNNLILAGSHLFKPIKNAVISELGHCIACEIKYVNLEMNWLSLTEKWKLIDTDAFFFKFSYVKWNSSIQCKCEIYFSWRVSGINFSTRPTTNLQKYLTLFTFS